MLSFDASGNILWKERIVFKNIRLSTVINGKMYEAERGHIYCAGNEITYEFKNDEVGAVGELKIIKCEQNSLLWWFDGKIIQKDVYLPIRVVDENAGYILTFDTLTADGLCARYMNDTCWSYVDFNAYKIPERTQSLLIKNISEHIAFVPLCTNKFRTQFCSEKVNEIKAYMGTGCNGYTDVQGYIMTISISDNPHESIELALNAAQNVPLYGSPLKEARPFPNFIKYLGWCTWDACYFDVSQSIIEQKMQEFKEKNVPVKWIIIDDGWFKFSENRIQSIYSDKNKFPDGLSGLIRILKEKYGVKYVGIWHSFNAYWYGVEENSEAYYDNKDFLIKTKAGVILPDFTDRDKAYKFFDKWHTYLRNEGIDFLKVDTQGCLNRFTENNISCVEAIRNIQEALEESVYKNFGGNMINCMAMGMEHTQFRKYSNILRNSEDFWPKRANSFKRHLTMNIYNALFLKNLYYLDFDMWWTNNAFAVQSAVLRAISGGPVYISDEIGATVSDLLMPLINDKGEIIMCDGAAVPSDDMLYCDYINNNRIIKVVNSVGDASVLALFNANESDSKTDAVVSYSDIKDKNSQEYIAYFYFSKKFYLFDRNTNKTISLNRNQTEIINFYPIKDNCIMLGDKSKYISSGCSPNKTPITSLDIEE